MKAFSNEELLDALPEFAELYSSRPIKNNDGGMKSPHMFPAWYIVKKLRPKVLIESGVWKGLGTWFFRQASPDTRIISIDPQPRFRQLDVDGVDYREEDFLTNNWSELTQAEKLDSLVFFDDHQNCVPRIMHCNIHGLWRMVFEDNYPIQQGDCVSPQKILSGKDYVIDWNGQRVNCMANLDHTAQIGGLINHYQVMPPIFKHEKTRWGDWWDHNYPTPDPLIQLPPDVQNFILPGEKEYEIFNERQDYTWLCYIELHRKW